jgi:hypothetical protein
MGKELDSTVNNLVSRLAQDPEYEKMLRGDLYYSFGPEMTAARRRCAIACKKFNAAEEGSRRKQVELWRKLVQGSQNFITTFF